jgi:hypothetical protein
MGSNKGAKVKIVRPKTIKSVCSKLLRASSISPPFLVSKNAPTISVVCGSRYLHKVVLPDFLSWLTVYFQQLYISSDDIHGKNGQPAMVSLHIVAVNSQAFVCSQPLRAATDTPYQVSAVSICRLKSQPSTSCAMSDRSHGGTSLVGN